MNDGGRRDTNVIASQNYFTRHPQPAILATLSSWHNVTPVGLREQQGINFGDQNEKEEIL